MNWIIRVLMKFNQVELPILHFLICRQQSQQCLDGIFWCLIIKKKIKVKA